MPNRTEISTLPPIYGLTLDNFFPPEQVPKKIRRIFALGEIPSSIANAIFRSLSAHSNGRLWKGTDSIKHTYIGAFIQAASLVSPRKNPNIRVNTDGFAAGKDFFKKNPELTGKVSAEKVCDIFELVRPKVNKRILQEKQAKQNKHGTNRPGPSRRR